MITKFSKFKINESLDFLNDLNREEYVESNNQGFNSKEDALEELNHLLDTPFPNGYKNIPNVFKLYRIVFLNSIEDLDSNKLGSHWTQHNDIYEDSYVEAIQNTTGAEGEPYVISGDFTIDKIDLEETLHNNINFPNEQEITIKEEPGNFSIQPLEDFIKDNPVTEYTYEKIYNKENNKDNNMKYIKNIDEFKNENFDSEDIKLSNEIEDIVGIDYKDMSSNLSKTSDFYKRLIDTNSDISNLSYKFYSDRIAFMTPIGDLLIFTEPLSTINKDGSYNYNWYNVITLKDGEIESDTDSDFEMIVSLLSMLGNRLNKDGNVSTNLN